MVIKVHSLKYNYEYMKNNNIIISLIYNYIKSKDLFDKKLIW
jgi:hypothetical protein